MNNYRNYAQKTSYLAGSNKLDLLPFYLTSVNIPGVNFNLNEIGGRAGALVAIAADNVSYNSLSLEILLDEDYKIYKEFMDIVFENVDIETGSFTDSTFDFWIQVHNNKGNPILKFEYFNCRIESVGDIELDTTSDETQFSMSTELKFDYFKIVDTELNSPTMSL